MEEVSLLSEEMMRVTRFFTWKAGDWDSKTNTEGWGVMSEVRIEGYTAYAKRQAALYRSLRQHVISLWGDIPAHLTRMQEIINNPALAEPGEFDDSQARGPKRSKS
jgi:hypothetical protein